MKEIINILIITSENNLPFYQLKKLKNTALEEHQIITLSNIHLCGKKKYIKFLKKANRLIKQYMP